MKLIKNLMFNRVHNIEFSNKPTTWRSSFFWLLDQFKGSKIRKHYDAIKRININHESDYATQQRTTYLNQILHHAVKTVPYYKFLGITATSLQHFPVVNKNLIKENSKSFLSESYVNKKTFNASTSGSTGTPFTVVHDKNKKRRHKADVHFFWETVGHTWGQGFYYFRIWNKQNRKSKFIQKIQNISPIEVFKLSDSKIKEFLNRIIFGNAPKSILSYASALDGIVKYLKRHPTDLSDAKVISIIAMSESLDNPTKNYLEVHFGCPVVSRYANTENGMLAQQTPFLENNFLLNLASYHIEILDTNADIPLEDGKTGRIVVTDFFNRAMPLIRYDTGDLGAMKKIEINRNIHYVLSTVEGRKMDAIFNTKGEPISPFTLTNNMWKYNRLNQYQFIQKGKNNYEFILNVQTSFTREKELINEFKGYLGSNANLAVTYVDEIPLLSSGKRKKVLNLTEK
ncbi:CoF synthetase [Zobellia uliginosa]|uniref:CoF synthetase n=1 Tax=Zobellia uliginosa TaxID=143224 RepID=UPI001C06C79A|nr:CoF synthetase [Zobellia uliginosa]MBU2948593.1 CoF synthetase [Zobellia uliginosa]